ncbi:microtubule-associated protein 6 homolog [Stigmatopora argus]
MAWPCISRACCMARFWNQMDKADIAVPLVFTKYTDASEMQQVQLQPPSRAGVAIETQPPRGHRRPVAGPRAPRRCVSEERVCSSVMREDFKHWRVRPEPSFKPKNEYHGPEIPFNSETQYQKDYKPWPIPKRYDHPWIPKPPATISAGDDRPPERSRHGKQQPADAAGGVEKSAVADKVQEKHLNPGPERKKRLSKNTGGEKKVVLKVEGEGRAAVDAVNRQIKQEISAGSSYKTEYKAYRDVKPAQMIRAKSQYLPPDEKTWLETSYSATYKGQAPVQATDNKAQERRRIRSLYSEPYMDPIKQVDRSTVPRTRAKKPMPVAHGQARAPKRAKEKSAAARGSGKTTSEKQAVSRPALGDKEKSKEMNNKLAEAKEVVLKQQHYVQLCQPIRDIGWVQTLKQHLWGCALPNPRDPQDEFVRTSHHHSQGATGGEPEPLRERPEQPRSGGVVRFAVPLSQTE